ncbi:peroxiredoxin family protein [Draconibacterium halophilum]|uniref:Peroxiredoxin family protein n=1 Tax=Draconibacterium halophilum TaxID=2706887 RepID=A0A6C0RGP2_9BACT|nr:redoxin domain-containing protein [Draconibacterium halophilum]QIA09590.1 peroxiredoxin family protein [Draconibacterium halophilum]
MRITEQMQMLPKACFYSLLGDSICIDEFDSQKNLVMIYFHPECEHCQYEAQEIGQNAIAFSSCQLLMITSDDSIPRVEDFCNNYNLWELENFEILLDKQNHFKEVFGRAVIPSVYIYDKEQKLKKQFLGETKPEAIIAEIGSDSDTLFFRE